MKKTIKQWDPRLIFTRTKNLYKAHPVEIRLTACLPPQKLAKSTKAGQCQGNSKLLSGAIKASESAKTASSIKNPYLAVIHKIIEFRPTNYKIGSIEGRKTLKKYNFTKSKEHKSHEEKSKHLEKISEANPSRESQTKCEKYNRVKSRFLQRLG